MAWCLPLMLATRLFTKWITNLMTGAYIADLNARTSSRVCCEGGKELHLGVAVPFGNYYTIFQIRMSW